jgi:serine/threonine protein kinase
VREARVAARLDHPNICSIYEVVGNESRRFIVMQYVEGETLANRISRNPIDVREAQYVYLTLQLRTEAQYETGKTYALRLARASTLPPAFTDETDFALIPGVQVIPHGGIFPGPTPSLYAYTRTTTHRNIYRIPVPFTMKRRVHH